MNVESNDAGYFGRYGGRFVDDKLKPVLQNLENAFKKYINDQDFIDELNEILNDFVGRPTPLLFAKNATNALGGGRLFLKMECLANTGAHKINNAIGQALLVKKMGKRRVIAETGAGQHGVATACACSRLGLECVIYMGKKDVIRQRPNVFWMEMFEAKVVPVDSGTKTLADAVDAALKDWINCCDDTHYLIGSALGPAPYPDMVREFQSIIGKEVKKQFQEKYDKLPDILMACVGGGSNAMGLFSDFLDNKNVRLIGVEAGGKSFNDGDHASRIVGNCGKEGIIQGYKSIFLQDSKGNLLPTHSISAGLDYAGISPQLASLFETGRIEFISATDSETLEAFKFFAKHEGMIVALESCHALAGAMKIIPTLDKNTNVIINVSGRGDKDLFITAYSLGKEKWFEFLKDEIKRGSSTNTLC